MDTCSSVGTLVLRLLTLAEAERFPHLGNKNGARVTAVFVLVPFAYFLGTFPSASIVARRAGKDVTQEGSGNPGASNVTRMLGWKAGLVVLLLDMGKGALAAGVGLALDGHRGAYILGVAAVLGHVFPITRQFKGGRGVATAGGVLVVLFPLAYRDPRRRVVRDRTRAQEGVDRVGRLRGPLPDHRRGARRRQARHRGHERARGDRRRASLREPAPPGARGGAGTRAWTR